MFVQTLSLLAAVAATPAQAEPEIAFGATMTGDTHQPPSGSPGWAFLRLAFAPDFQTLTVTLDAAGVDAPIVGLRLFDAAPNGHGPLVLEIAPRNCPLTPGRTDGMPSCVLGAGTAFAQGPVHDLAALASALESTAGLYAELLTDSGVGAIGGVVLSATEVHFAGCDTVTISATSVHMAACSTASM